MGWGWGWKQRYSSALYLTSALDEGVGGQRDAPAALPPGLKPGAHCAGGLVGSRAGLGWRGKFSLPLGFDPRTVHPVSSCYTDYVIPDHETKRVLSREKSAF